MVTFYSPKTSPKAANTKQKWHFPATRAYIKTLGTNKTRKENLNTQRDIDYKIKCGAVQITLKIKTLLR